MTTTTQEQIEQTKHSLANSKTELQELRTKRAHLALNKGSVAEIAKLDKKIDDLVRNINNAPATVAILEDKLKEEQAQAAQVERDQLLVQQKKVAKEIEELSEDFVNTLTRAVELNTQILPALQAEASLRAKTGATVLESYCQGSQESLEKLLALMQYQMEGQHTTEGGPGIVGSNVQIRL